jgi:alkanesulfonate monooxygenase SsuD/methylene tetrahydromethanopterin reductase-like flavin-dependent oxidoreductase (luciferase family)
LKREYWEIVQSMPAAEMTRLMREFEDLGLHGVWVPQLHAPPFPTMAAAAMASTKLKIGSGIALAFTRSPVETALNALDIDRISNGRTVLGLGTSVRAFNEDIHGVAYAKPVERLREATNIVRAIIEKGHTGKLADIEGGYYKSKLSGFNSGRKPVRESIPIWLPALFDKTAQLALEIADGMMGHPIWSLATMATNSARVADSIAARGRNHASFHVNLWNYAAISNDRKSAIDDMRGTVAFYASIRQYEKYYASHGFGAAARAASDAAARRDTSAMIKAIPDEMVTTFAISGTPDDARDRVAMMWKHCDSMTLSAPSNFLAGEKVAAYRSAIVNTFYKA